MKKISYLDFLIKVISPLIVVIGFWWMYQKEILLFEDLGYDIFLTDESGIFIPKWETTQHQTIQYSIVFPKKIYDWIMIDTSELEKKLNIKEIQINGKKVEKDDIFPGDENTQITIIWEKISWWDIDTKEKLVEIIPVDSEEIQEILTTEWEINIRLEKNNFLSDFNNTIEIFWEWKNFVEFLTIWENSFQVQHKDWKSFILIPKNTFQNGTFFWIAQSKSGKFYPLSNPILFTYSQENINIQAITPNTIKNSQIQNIVIQWRGFSKILSLQLSNNIILKNTNFEIVSDQILIVSIPEWIDEWKYHFNILSPEKIHQIKSHILTITQ